MNDHLKAHRDFQQRMNDSMIELRETFQAWLQQRQEQVVNLDSYTPEPSQYHKIPIYYDDDDESFLFPDFSDSNDDFTSIDDDSFSIDNIDYVEASPLDSELVNLEVVEIVISEVGGVDIDILLTIKDDDFPDCDDSRARGFVLRSLELHILSFIMGIQYPNLID
ncbi:hypothetical protein Tco_1418595 [Tanacetum coccineum]